MQRLDRSGYELIFPVEHHRLNIDLTFAVSPNDCLPVYRQ
jgi:hypothetical protein